MDKLNEWDKKLEESKQRDKEKKKNEPSFKERWKTEVDDTEKKVKEKQEAQKEKQANTTQQEKLAKESRFLMKGCAFWLLIPFLGLLAIALLFFGAWILDLLGIL